MALINGILRVEYSRIGDKMLVFNANEAMNYRILSFSGCNALFLQKVKLVSRHLSTCVFEGQNICHFITVL